MDEREAPISDPRGQADAVLCGVDLVEIDSLAHDLVIAGKRFLSRVYTEREQRECSGDVAALAVRFAVKEAMAKALGTGIRGVRWTEIEVLQSATTWPDVRLSGAAAARARTLGVTSWSISVSRSRRVALACIVGCVGTGESQHADVPAPDRASAEAR